MIENILKIISQWLGLPTTTVSDFIKITLFNISMMDFLIFIRAIQLSKLVHSSRCVTAA